MPENLAEHSPHSERGGPSSAELERTRPTSPFSLRWSGSEIGGAGTPIPRPSEHARL